MDKIFALFVGFVTYSAAASISDGASAARFRIEKNAVHGQSRFFWKDIDALLSIDGDGDGILSTGELEASRQFLEDFGEMLYTLKRDDELVSIPTAKVAMSGDGHIVFDLRFPLDAGATNAELELDFAAAPDFPLNHQHALSVWDADGNVIIDEISDRSRCSPVYPAAEANPEEVQVLARVKEAARKASPISSAHSSERPGSVSRAVWILLSAAAGWCFHIAVLRIRQSVRP